MNLGDSANYSSKKFLSKFDEILNSIYKILYDKNPHTMKGIENSQKLRILNTLKTQIQSYIDNIDPRWYYVRIQCDDVIVNDITANENFIVTIKYDTLYMLPSSEFQYYLKYVIKDHTGFVIYENEITQSNNTFTINLPNLHTINSGTLELYGKVLIPNYDLESPEVHKKVFIVSSLDENLMIYINFIVPNPFNYDNYIEAKIYGNIENYPELDLYEITSDEVNIYDISITRISISEINVKFKIHNPKTSSPKIKFLFRSPQGIKTVTKNLNIPVEQETKIYLGVVFDTIKYIIVRNDDHNTIVDNIDNIVPLNIIYTDGVISISESNNTITITAANTLIDTFNLINFIDFKIHTEGNDIYVIFKEQGNSYMILKVNKVTKTIYKKRFSIIGADFDITSLTIWNTDLNIAVTDRNSTHILINLNKENLEPFKTLSIPFEFTINENKILFNNTLGTYNTSLQTIKEIYTDVMGLDHIEFYENDILVTYNDTNTKLAKITNNFIDLVIDYEDKIKPISIDSMFIELALYNNYYAIKTTIPNQEGTIFINSKPLNISKQKVNLLPSNNSYNLPINNDVIFF